MLVAVMVTHERPKTAMATLEAVLAQSERPARVHVVDNSDVHQLETVDFSRMDTGVEVLHPAVNLGPAGGYAYAFERVLASLDDDDLVLLIDDDDPPPVDGLIEELVALALAERRRGNLAGVGLSGGVFDWARGRWQRMEAEPGQGLIEVDYLNGGYLPIYAVRALRAARPFDPRLFWGFEELDSGLTMRAAGFTLLMHGALWAEVAHHYPKAAARGRPRYGARPPTWRRYCSTRNQVYVLRKHGYRRRLMFDLFPRLALKYTVNLPARPVVTCQAAICDLRAIVDGLSESGMEGQRTCAGTESTLGVRPRLRHEVSTSRQILPGRMLARPRR